MGLFAFFTLFCCIVVAGVFYLKHTGKLFGVWWHIKDCFRDSYQGVLFGLIHLTPIMMSILAGIIFIFFGTISFIIMKKLTMAKYGIFSYKDLVTKIVTNYINI